MERRPTAAGLRLTVVALLLTVALGATPACSGDGSSQTGSRTPSGSAEGAEGDDTDDATSGSLELEPSTSTTTNPEDRALSELLLGDAPLPGFERADDVLTAGPLDLDAAAAAETDVAAERALLETRGFRRGASRAWIDPGQDVVYLAVYEFETAEGAAAYLVDGGETLAGRGATTFEVPEMDGAMGFTTIEESPQGTFTAHAVAFTRDERWVLALVGSPGSGRTPDEARAVAAAQAGRLG